MRIVTSKGDEYCVNWIDVPVQDENRLLMQMATDKTLVELVVAFDGLEWIERFDENQGDKRYEGFTRLVVMARIEHGKTMIVLERGETD